MLTLLSAVLRLCFGKMSLTNCKHVQLSIADKAHAILLMIVPIKHRIIAVKLIMSWLISDYCCFWTHKSHLIETSDYATWHIKNQLENSQNVEMNAIGKCSGIRQMPASSRKYTNFVTMIRRNITFCDYCLLFAFQSNSSRYNLPKSAWN